MSIFSKPTGSIFGKPSGPSATAFGTSTPSTPTMGSGLTLQRSNATIGGMNINNNAGSTSSLFAPSTPQKTPSASTNFTSTNSIGLFKPTTSTPGLGLGTTSTSSIG